MEPKKIKKLVLKKEIISQLDQHNLKGGRCAMSTTCSSPDVSICCGGSGDNCTDNCITYHNDPNDCNTIGHDDGDNCYSKSDTWCWCYGR